MKKKFIQLILFALVLMTASTVLAAKKTPDEQRAECLTLEKFFAKLVTKLEIKRISYKRKIIIKKERS